MAPLDPPEGPTALVPRNVVQASVASSSPLSGTTLRVAAVPKARPAQISSSAAGQNPVLADTASASQITTPRVEASVRLFQQTSWVVMPNG